MRRCPCGSLSGWQRTGAKARPRCRFWQLMPPTRSAAITGRRWIPGFSVPPGAVWVNFDEVCRFVSPCVRQAPLAVRALITVTGPDEGCGSLRAWPASACRSRRRRSPAPAAPPSGRPCPLTPSSRKLPARPTTSSSKHGRPGSPGPRPHPTRGWTTPLRRSRCRFHPPCSPRRSSWDGRSSAAAGGGTSEPPRHGAPAARPTSVWPRAFFASSISASLGARSRSRPT